MIVDEKAPAAFLGKISERELMPQSIVVCGFFDPRLSVGSAVSPIYLATTFVSESAEAAEESFKHLEGGSENVYGRHNNPLREIFEHRLAQSWDEAEAAAAFSSGMAAIETTFREFIKYGDVVVHSEPVYGCTNDALKRQLREDLNVTPVGFSCSDDYDAIVKKASREVSRLLKEEKRQTRVALIFVETPSNPLLTMFDIEMCSRVANTFESMYGHRPLVVVDNTFNGPIGQRPLKHGANLVVYSATKYIGGHSDVMAGAVVGSESIVNRIKKRRMIAGDMLDPFSAFLLLRSLPTLDIRVKKQTENAQVIIEVLSQCKEIEHLYYPTLLKHGDPQHAIYCKQCTVPGAMISFRVRGGKAAAFRFLNRLQMIKLAVSLGSVESLIEHPATTSHGGIEEKERERMGIADNLVRLSVGLEHVDDLVKDLTQALDGV